MDKKQTDEFLKALVSAYVWVASADGGVDGLELHKYEHGMVQSQFATQFNVQDVRRYFKDMVAVFADEYEAGIELTRERLIALRGKDHLTEEVLRLCRAAVVADGKIQESEENVLKEIRLAMGINSF